MMSHEELVKKMMSDPEVYAAYAAQEDEFALLDAALPQGAPAGPRSSNNGKRGAE
jgi:hypothetical protein